jgi:hypothetical protein
MGQKSTLVAFTLFALSLFAQAGYSMCGKRLYFDMRYQPRPTDFARRATWDGSPKVHIGYFGPVGFGT